MTWSTSFLRAPGALRIARLTIVLAAPVMRATAQATTPAPVTPTAPLAAYRSPTIALAQPTPGTGVPADRPVVVFRFTQGEPDDPIDQASLRVWVDGADRSASFQVANDDAWGTLASLPSATDSIGRPAVRAALPAGVHLVVARICSTRGVCGEVRVPVTVLPGAETLAASGSLSDSARNAQASVPTATKQSLGRKVLDILLGGVRKLVSP